MDHPLNNLIKVSLENIKEMVEVNTVVGEAIKSNNTMILPISRVKATFLAGGTDFKIDPKTNESKSFGGVTTASVNVNPIAFLVVENDSTKILLLEEGPNVYDKLIEKAPEIFDAIKEFLKNNENN